MMGLVMMTVISCRGQEWRGGQAIGAVYGAPAQACKWIVLVTLGERGPVAANEVGRDGHGPGLLVGPAHPQLHVTTRINGGEQLLLSQSFDVPRTPLGSPLVRLL